MTNLSRKFLVAAIVSSVYLIYVIGVALVSMSPQAGIGYILPFFLIHTYGGVKELIDTVAALTILVWILWGIEFTRS